MKRVFSSDGERSSQSNYGELHVERDDQNVFEDSPAAINLTAFAQTVYGAEQLTDGPGLIVLTGVVRQEVLITLKLRHARELVDYLTKLIEEAPNA